VEFRPGACDLSPGDRRTRRNAFDLAVVLARAAAG
jgi:hypothetical protein